MKSKKRRWSLHLFIFSEFFIIWTDITPVWMRQKYFRKFFSIKNCSSNNMQKYIFIGEGKFENILTQRSQKTEFFNAYIFGNNEIQKSSSIWILIFSSRPTRLARNYFLFGIFSDPWKIFTVVLYRNITNANKNDALIIYVPNNSLNMLPISSK